MRIASSAVHQLASADIARAQQELFEAQRQAGSERRAPDLKGYARDARALISARGYEARTDAYSQAGEALKNRAALQDVAISQMQEGVSGLREAVTDAVALNKGAEMMNRIDAAFAAVSGALNMDYAGVYVFGGVREDAQPVAADTLQDVAAHFAAGTLDQAFVNAPRAASVQIDARTVVQAGPLADDLGQEVFRLFGEIQQYENDNGPFGEELTDAQRTFLSGKIAEIEVAARGVISHQSRNGALQSQVEQVISRQNEQNDYFSSLVAEIEEVDLAEVATRLSQAQTTLQASAQIYSSLRNLSLLNFL